MPTTLWDFSLETYRRPGVEEACLKLQDELGADVNMLFYCCWRGEFVAGEMGALLAELAPWQDGVVCGLRTVRRTLKPMLAELRDLSEPVAGLRRKVAALELEAEKLQQDMLTRHAEEYAKDAPPAPHAAVQNLKQYLRCLTNAPDRNAVNGLETLIEAAFTNAPKGDVKAALAVLNQIMET